MKRNNLIDYQTSKIHLKRVGEWLNLKDLKYYTMYEVFLRCRNVIVFKSIRFFFRLTHNSAIGEQTYGSKKFGAWIKLWNSTDLHSITLSILLMWICIALFQLRLYLSFEYKFLNWKLLLYFSFEYKFLNWKLRLSVYVNVETDKSG